MNSNDRPGGFLQSLIISFSIFIHASSFAAPVDQSQFQTRLSALTSSDPEVALFLRQRRIDRGRDPGSDLKLARILHDNPFAANVVMPLVQELADTFEFQTNQELLQGAILATPDGPEPTRRALKQFEEVLDHSYFHFTPEDRQSARFYIQGGTIVNAWSFTNKPQTIFTAPLLRVMTPEENKGVIAHEMTHAQSGHNPNMITVYGVLLAAGYYMFDDTGYSLAGNPLLRSFKDNIGSMTAPLEEIAGNSSLNALEKGIATSLSHFAGHSSDPNYSSQMKLYLDSIAELSVKIGSAARQSGRTKEFQNLVYLIENVLIDDEALKMDRWIVNKRMSDHQVISSPLNGIVVDLMTYLKAVYRGIFAMTRSFERTADKGAVVVVGGPVEETAFTKFLGSEFANPAIQRSQLTMAEQDRVADPGRAVLLDPMTSHPPPNMRIDAAHHFEDTFQYRSLSDPFVKMVYDALDISIYYASTEGLLEAENEGKIKNLQNLRAGINQKKTYLEYVTGQRKQRPKDFYIPVGLDKENYEYRRHHRTYGPAVQASLEADIQILEVQVARLEKVDNLEVTVLRKRLDQIRKAKNKLIQIVINTVVEDLEQGSTERLADIISAVNYKVADNNFLNIDFAISNDGFVQKLLRKIKRTLRWNAQQITALESELLLIINEAKEKLAIEESFDERLDAFIARIHEVARLRNQTTESLLSSLSYDSIDDLARDIVLGSPACRDYMLIQNQTFREIRDDEDLIEHANEHGYETPEQLVDAVIQDNAQSPILGRTPMSMSPIEVAERIGSIIQKYDQPTTKSRQRCTQVFQ